MRSIITHLFVINIPYKLSHKSTPQWKYSQVKRSSSKPSDRSNNQNKHPTQTSRKPAQRKNKKLRREPEPESTTNKVNKKTATKAVQVVESNSPEEPEDNFENAQQQQDPPRHQANPLLVFP
jgi:hypothetical protein